MKHRVVTFLLFLPLLAFAQPMASVKNEGRLLNEMLDICAVKVRTLFVELRAGIKSSDIDVAQCAASGKTAAKEAYSKVLPAFGKKKPPQELAEWRLEWVTAFDSAVPAMGETERVYLQRQALSKQAIARATNKLEIAVE